MSETHDFSLICTKKDIYLELVLYFISVCGRLVLGVVISHTMYPRFQRIVHVVCFRENMSCECD